MTTRGGPCKLCCASSGARLDRRRERTARNSSCHLHCVRVAEHPPLPCRKLTRLQPVIATLAVRLVSELASDRRKTSGSSRRHAVPNGGSGFLKPATEVFERAEWVGPKEGVELLVDAVSSSAAPCGQLPASTHGDDFERSRASASFHDYNGPFGTGRTATSRAPSGFSSCSSVTESLVGAPPAAPLRVEPGALRRRRPPANGKSGKRADSPGRFRGVQRSSPTPSIERNVFSPLRTAARPPKFDCALEGELSVTCSSPRRKQRGLAQHLPVASRTASVLVTLSLKSSDRRGAAEADCTPRTFESASAERCCASRDARAAFRGRTAVHGRAPMSACQSEVPTWIVSERRSTSTRRVRPLASSGGVLRVPSDRAYLRRVGQKSVEVHSCQYVLNRERITTCCRRSFRPRQSLSKECARHAVWAC